MEGLKINKIFKQELITIPLVALFAMLIVLLITSQAIASTTYTSSTTLQISNTATGGDCSLVGNWDAATSTCTLTADVSISGVDGINIDSDGISIDGNGHTLTGNLTSYTAGVRLTGRIGVSLENLTVQQFNAGLYLDSSNNNIILNNTSVYNKGGALSLTNSSSDNRISENTFSNNYGGILLYSSNSNNIISGNTVSSNTSDGIWLQSGASGNQIYHNNFINNGTQVNGKSQAVVESNIGTGNVFNLSAPIGGNYWSDWTPPDTNLDGFVDSPLLIYDNYNPPGGSYAADYLPLTQPIASGKPVLTLSQPAAFWNSYSDYLSGLLSVSWTVNNTGPAEAWSVALIESANSNGVTLVSTLPVAMGSSNILAGSSGIATLKYNVPQGVSSWRSSLTASAQDGVGTTYTYP